MVYDDTTTEYFDEPRRIVIAVLDYIYCINLTQPDRNILDRRYAVMRLINVETFKLEEFHEASPPYAILSHTWGADSEEVFFRDIQEGKFEKDGTLPIKFEGSCKLAKEDGYRYIWIDTCCIDKTNSVELTEAINSMFRWYMEASICYSYLSDVPVNDNPRDPRSKFFSSRWFERGWTLQELLAPPKLRFYNSEWRYLGSKGEMCTMIEKITGVPSPFLLGIADLQAASVAQRMSWAARRVTKRKEDIAYSLLGIFGVTMPMIYGEGGERAFRRLQEQIMKDIRDDSILAWGLNLEKSKPENSSEVISWGILAAAPSDFANCRQIVRREQFNRNSFDMIGGSLRLRLSIITTSPSEIIGLLGCGPENDTNQVVGIPLAKTTREPSDEYIRPQGCYPILLPNTASNVSIKLIQIRNEQQSVASATTNRRYWFHVQESFETNLELIDVWPRSHWHKERALIEMATLLDDHVTQQTLTRFRQKDEGSHDFVILLELKAQNPQAQAQCHVMISSRDTSLEDMARKLSTISQRAFGKQIASNGIINLQVTLEPVKTQPMFIIKPTTTSSVPEITIDMTSELRQLDLRLEIEIITVAEDKITREENKLSQTVEGTSTILDKLKKEVEVVEEEQRKLNEKRRFLIKEVEDNTQEMDQLNIKLNKIKQGRENISKRRLETQRCLHELLDNDIIAKGASGNGQDSDAEGHTALSWAAANGHEFVVRQLLENRADIELMSKTGYTPLIWAVMNGHEDVVRLLLDNGADINSTDDRNWTALTFAAANGHEALVRLFLAKGVNIELMDIHGRTPLSLTAASGNEAMVRLLLDKGADIESKDKEGRTPLSWATTNGHEAVVRLLLYKSAGIELKNQDMLTLVTLAATNRHEAVLRLLIAKNNNIEAKNEEGLTLLSWAAKNGYEVMVRLLLEISAEIESEDNKGRTPLGLAAAKGYEVVVRLLLDNGAAINSKDNQNLAPLHQAIQHGHEAVLRLLLKHGANVNSNGNHNLTPLHQAVWYEHEAVARLLLEQGADINSLDDTNWTALTLAAIKGHEALVRLFLAKGAIIEPKDISGRTPLSYAAQYGYKGVARMLLDAGADATSKDTQDQTPLSLAAANRHDIVVKMLESSQ